jgi:phage tail-like protein
MSLSVGIGGGLSGAISGAESAVAGLLGGGASSDGGPVAIANRFSVSIDGIDLGYFSKVEGLSISVKTDKLDQGGNDMFKYAVPSGLEWQDVKITRPVAQGNTDLAQLVSAGGDRTRPPTRYTAVITFYDVTGATVMSWSLQGAMATGWTGPNGDVGSSATATETLTLTHHGFIFGGAGGGLGGLAGAAAAAVGAAASAIAGAL